MLDEVLHQKSKCPECTYYEFIDDDYRACMLFLDISSCKSNNYRYFVVRRRVLEAEAEVRGG